MAGEHRAGARPEPVLAAGSMAGLASAVASLIVGSAVLAGWVDQASAPALVDALVALGLGVVTVVGAVGPILAARKARAQVTPLAAPAVELADGTTVPARLVPMAEAQTGHPAG